MFNSSFKVNRRQKRNPFWTVLLVVLVAVVLAFVVSGAWQIAEGKPFFPPQGDLLPPSKPPAAPAVSTSSSSESEGKIAKEKNSSSSSDASSAASSEDEKKELPVFEGAVPAAPAVEQTYFDDAVFVGDSITEGMLIYSGMENATILAGTGVNFSTVYTSAVMKNAEDGTRSTIMDELPKKQYAKVYVMLGGNEVRDMSKESFLQRYEKLLDDIRAIQPDALIYVQSMTPVTPTNTYNMDNERIDEFNQAILEMCQRKKFYYLNVAESMKDESGALPTEASPKDGMHFGQPYFDKWIAYLKTHTVPTQTEKTA